MSTQGKAVIAAAAWLAACVVLLYAASFLRHSYKQAPDQWWSMAHALLATGLLGAALVCAVGCAWSIHQHSCKRSMTTHVLPRGQGV